MTFSYASIEEIAAPTPRSIAIGPFGSSLRADTYTGEGVPIVRGQNIGDSPVISESDLVFVAAETAARFPGCQLRKGDLVFPHRGAIGRVAIVGNREMMLSSSMMKLTCDPAKADPLFVLYYFRGPGKHQLLTYASTVGTPGIGQPLTSLKGIQIALPPVDEQRAIAEVLGALDDKIAANTALISVADDLAEQKFLAMTINDNVSRPLSSLARFVNGKAFTKDATGTGRVVIRIAELNSGLGNSTVYNDLEVAEQYLAGPGDLLFAWSGSLTVQRWFREEGIVNQHIFKVIPVDVPLWVLNGALRAKLAAFRGIAADKATTMGHIQRHNLDEPVLVPGDEAIACADAAMQGLWDRALQAERESLKLAELRDTLLPELMSGRLRVENAERLVEGEV